MRKLEDEKEKVKAAEQKQRSAHKNNEMNAALQDQRINFLENDLKGLQDQLDLSESTIQDLRNKLGESEQSKESFLSRNEEMNRVELEQVRAQYEAQISKLRESQ